MRTFSKNPRRFIGTVALVATLALGASACGSGASKSDSDACGSGGGGGNLKTCISISDFGSSEGDAVIPAGTSVTIVCKDNSSVGIVIPKAIKGGDLGQAEWKYEGKAAARGISADYFNSVPSGLKSCDSILKRV